MARDSISLGEAGARGAPPPVFLWGCRMSDDRLRLEYVPLDLTLRWDRNAKRHDLRGIAASFAQHGFKDPAKFEPLLNGGRGGIGEGNGRFEALAHLRDTGQAVPRGIVVADGVWLVPVLFGVDAASEAAAEAYAVDHNNLTLGPGFNLDEMLKLWEDGFLQTLDDIQARGGVTVSADVDAVDKLVRQTLARATADGGAI